MSKKVKIMLICAVLICLSILGTGTLTYFTTESTARNVITTGKIDVDVSFPTEAILVMPGTTVDSPATVTGASGSQPAWVRAKVDFTVCAADGSELQISEQELSAVIICACDSTAWTERGGWWYCNDTVSAGESVSLFEELQFSGPDMRNEFQNCTVQIDVIVQAVQSANNGTTVFDAVGWPV